MEKKEKKLSKDTILLVTIIVFIILIDQSLKIWVQNAGEISIISEILKFKQVQLMALVPIPQLCM